MEHVKIVLTTLKLLRMGRVVSLIDAEKDNSY